MGHCMSTCNFCEVDLSTLRMNGPNPKPIQARQEAENFVLQNFYILHTFACICPNFERVHDQIISDHQILVQPISARPQSHSNNIDSSSNAHQLRVRLG